MGIFKKYKPNIERIKKGRKKYSKFISVDKKMQMILHRFYINGERSKIRLVHIEGARAKRKHFNNRRMFNDFIGIYWTNKKAINTYFTKFNVDAIFADRFGNVINTVQDIEPNTFSDYHKKGWYVILFQKGMLSVEPIRIGDHIQIWTRKQKMIKPA